MADVELVIKIPDYLYKSICSNAEVMIYGGMRSGKTLLATLLRAIRIGKPLPKRHGRLIDTNEITAFRELECKGHNVESLDEFTTIIEANRESEE